MLFCLLLINRKLLKIVTENMRYVIIQIFDKKFRLTLLVELQKNRDDKIRTCGPRDPNTVRYQTALHPDNIKLFPLRRGGLGRGLTSPYTLIINRQTYKSSLSSKFFWGGKFRK